ncbi:MAG: hypothetical protein PHO70_04710 [Candidatus Omnitrophica bacterium]|nr:hypothetical protein [Candidatus Omnitrophota bacterium]
MYYIFMKRLKLFLIFVIITAIPIIAYCQGEKPLAKLVIFHSPSCHRCIEVKNEVMPEIEKEFKGRVEIEYRDISDVENYKHLLGLKEKYLANLKIDLPVFFLNGRFLTTEGQVKIALTSFISDALNNQGYKDEVAKIDIVKYFKSFKLAAIVGAGLVDGINPCAFTVIVFFVSFLSFQGYRRRELIVIGLSFILAVFLTYFLLGLGVFNFLYALKGFWMVTKIANFSIGILSVILGCFALYDFFKYKKTGDTEGLLLQLPKSIKNKIHYVIGLHYRKEKGKQEKAVSGRLHLLPIISTAFVTGVSVSILEAICTGQTYLPTISFVLKTATLKFQALLYLLIYNLMFIIPLLVIFILALAGTTPNNFSNFLKKHLLTIKLLMIFLFFGLGIFLIWRG